jgi:Protein of unknown function (DUF3093)
MRVYHERLRVPLSWWLLGLAAVALLGAELVPLLNAVPVTSAVALVTLAAYGLFACGVAAMLVSWGRARIEVTPAELRAGRGRLPLAAVGNVTILGEAQARALRGRHADPAAYLMTRPFLRQAVLVEVTGPAVAAPYWMVGTRDAAGLASAIRSACPAARADGGAMG